MEVGEVDVEAAIVLVVRVEGQPEHSLLQVVALDQRAQVEERIGQKIAILVDDPDEPGPLDDKEPAATVVGRRDVDRIGQATGDLDELDGRVTRQRPTGLDSALARSAALGLVESRWKDGRGLLSRARQRSAEEPSPGDSEHEQHGGGKLDARHGVLLSRRVNGDQGGPGAGAILRLRGPGYNSSNGWVTGVEK